MDLLLTWSGTPSHEIATFFRDWLPSVVPGIQPWISSQDIAKGKRWFDELTVQMGRTTISITFITPGNVRSPWVFYEIGVIAAKMGEGTVCPYLIDVDMAQVKDTPIGQFQCTEATKDDTFLLIQSINENLGDKGHDPGLITGNFTTHWPKLRRRIEKVVEASPTIVNKVTETERSVEEQLTEQARRLLIEANKGDAGRILRVSSGDGIEIRANSENLITDQSGRCLAIWEGALKELIAFGLVEDIATQGQVFRITREGYNVVDLITSRDT